jgi:predicted porin
MKLKQHALTLGCLAAMGLTGAAQAIEVAGSALEVYGVLYPELNHTAYSDSAATGTALSNMTKGLVTPGTQTFAAGAASKDQLNWSQSYIGVKGMKAFGDVTVGYDFQGVMAPNKSLDSSIATGGQQSLFGDTRDAFVSVAHKSVGTFQFGQMDTIYKEYGDRVRMLGVSSSNFTSTSGVLSGVGWKSATKDSSTTTYSTVGSTTTATTVTTAAAGTTSFNTRIGGQIRWESPVWNGFQAGVSYRPDTTKTADRDQSLSAVALRWTQGPYYVAVQQEVHNDYRAFSGTGVVEKSSTILNKDPHSKDTAQRITFGYKNGPLQLGADLARLEYTEAAVTTGKFSSYNTTTWQIAADYAVGADWNLAANYAKGAAGSCTLLGGASCSTTGQGGSLLSLGAKYNYDKNIGIFAMYGLNTANDSATYASSAIGGKTTNFGLGALIKF